MKPTLIRRETVGDHETVELVVRRAFTEGGSSEPVEVRLIAQLRRSDAWLPRLALVALVDGALVGSVICTRALLEPAGYAVLGLGPIGVDPVHQGQGIGTALMHAVLAAADACDETLVGLVGEPEFYRRFAFVPAADLGITSPDAAWGDYFQVRRLSSYTTALQGQFRYAEPFQGL